MEEVNRRSILSDRYIGGVLPGGEALLIRQNPIFSDQRAPTQMNLPKEI